MIPTGERFIPGQSGSIELEHLNRYYFVINQFDLKDKIVIDLASGEGYGAVLLSNYSKKVIGIDINQESVYHAKNKYIRDNLEFTIGDASKIPLPDKTADIFVSFETIEHHCKHIEMIEEVKRVLKSDGLLIISSPDKYYYSDLPNYKNEYHVKELYYEEFKSLIKSNFKKSFFFFQRVFSGSIIVLDEGIIPYKKPLVINKNGCPNDFSPVYNIAIASDQSSLNIKYPMITYSDIEKEITQENLDNENLKGQQKIRDTKSYKLGYFLLNPFKKILGYL